MIQPFSVQTSAHDARISQGSCGQLVWESFARLNILAMLESCSCFYCSSASGRLFAQDRVWRPRLPRPGLLSAFPLCTRRGPEEQGPPLVLQCDTPRSQVAVLLPDTGRGEAPDTGRGEAPWPVPLGSTEVLRVWGGGQLQSPAGAVGRNKNGAKVCA